MSSDSCTFAGRENLNGSDVFQLLDCGSKFPLGEICFFGDFFGSDWLLSFGNGIEHLIQPLTADLSATGMECLRTEVFFAEE